MRMPFKDENLVGKVCVCSVGRVAIVTGRYTPEWAAGKEMWCGIGFDGKGTWASESPCVVAESGDEFRQKLSVRFGGKMSFNG